MAEAIKIHDLRPAPGAHKAKTRVTAVKAPRVRPQVAVPRVPRHVTRFVQASKA